MTTAVILLDRLTANIRLLQKLVGSCPMWPVIKANVCGHGAEIFARHWAGLGYGTLSVAHVEEFVRLIDVTELQDLIKLDDEAAIIGLRPELPHRSPELVASRVAPALVRFGLP
jgi:alanine racemase